jgi:DNA modification methylase
VINTHNKTYLNKDYIRNQMMNHLKLEYWPIEKCIDYSRNPRKNDSVVAKMVASIKEFGFTIPILCQSDGLVIDGHLRLKGAKKLEIKEVPVVIADHMTEAQVKAFRLLANRSANWAEWDDELLKLEFNDLKLMDFDLSLTGFEQKELDSLSINEPIESGDTEPEIDQSEELLKKYGVQFGQCWMLGKHRLLCGDSTKKEEVDYLLKGDKPLMMVTDPPYGVEYDAEWRNDVLGGKAGGRATGKVTNDDRCDWREVWSLFQGDVAYVWHGSSRSPFVAESLIDSGFELRNLIIWAKNHFAIGRGNYHHQHEPCWYSVRQGANACWGGDRTQSTIWNIDKPQKSDTGHSTQKPLECMLWPIRNHTIEMIYDPFCGSGTTIIAAENLNRVCRAMEISPAYCAVILERFYQHTHQEPKLIVGEV